MNMTTRAHTLIEKDSESTPLDGLVQIGVIKNAAQHHEDLKIVPEGSEILAKTRDKKL